MLNENIFSFNLNLYIIIISVRYNVDIKYLCNSGSQQSHGTLSAKNGEGWFENLCRQKPSQGGQRSVPRATHRQPGNQHLSGLETMDIYIYVRCTSCTTAGRTRGATVPRPPASRAGRCACSPAARRGRATPPGPASSCPPPPPRPASRAATPATRAATVSGTAPLRRRKLFGHDS